MELKTKEDIDAPIEHVFRALSDFDNLERVAARRGIEVVRNSDSTVCEGMQWSVKYPLRGKVRNRDMQLDRFQPSTFLGMAATGDGISGNLEVDLVALSPNVTRMAVSVELTATTLPGRLLLQSAKLARSRVEEKFAERIAKFVPLRETRIKDYA